MKSGIYKITNTVNGKFYVGSSKNIEERWESHKRYLRGKYHVNPKLQHAWDFYGEEKFQFDIIEEVNNDEKLLLEREQYHLDLWKPYHRTIGYNICPKSQGGDNFTYNPRREEIRQELSEMFSGENNPMFGKTHTDDAIKQQKEKAKGRYTLEWFIERYGKKKGEQKFQKRRLMLANRSKSCFIHPSPIPTFKGQKHKKGWMEKRIKTQEYFKNNWEKFIDLVKSGKYSERQLSEILNIPRTTIRARIKKINS